MLLRVQKMLALAVRAPTATNVRFFSKEAPKKDAKKDDKAAPAAPVVQEPSLDELAIKWITHTHESLSPSELKLYREGFEDLSASDKEILDGLAEKLVELPTAIFYDAVLKKGALGTSELYYTAVDPLTEQEIPAYVKGIRKEL